MQGTVKWFNQAKGYGFLEAVGTESDVFVHFSAIEMDGFKTLVAGQRVDFQIGHGTQGAQAEAVKVLP